MKLLGSILRYKIKSYIKHNYDKVLSDSLENCHAIGVHSVLLYKDKVSCVRFFITFPNHTLYRNWNVGMYKGKVNSPLSIGFHPHHCDLKFIGLRGVFFNISAEKTDEVTPFKPFLYSSPIKGKKPKFSLTDRGCVSVLGREVKKEGSVFKMSAQDIHTIFVPKGEISAWLIREGKGDPSYEPICYSNDNLENFGFSGINIPMSAKTLDKIIELL